MPSFFRRIGLFNRLARLKLARGTPGAPASA